MTIASVERIRADGWFKEANHSGLASWSMITAVERAGFLSRMAQIVRTNVEELSALLTFEQGKPLAEARNEMKLGAFYLKWFAEEARRINGEFIPSPWKDRQILVTREPIGVVDAISPWNFSFSMLSRKMAPALAAGCTTVIKPSQFTPYCGLLYGILAEKAGIQTGVVNVVSGDGAAVGAELCDNALVRKITFAGSTRVGKLLYAQFAGTMKKLSMELGGIAPTIVFDDADLNLAVENAVAGKFRNSGQTCICTNRFYVQDAIYDEFARRLAGGLIGLTSATASRPVSSKDH